MESFNQLSGPSLCNDRFIETYANHSTTFPPASQYSSAHNAHDRRRGRTLNWPPSQSDPCGSASNFGLLTALDCSQALDSHRQSGTYCRNSSNFCCYPSPPSSSTSLSKVSLPPSEAFMYTSGGVLDSPVVIHHRPLCTTPISPPPTIPSRIHALPDAETVECYSSPSSSTPELDDGSIESSPVEPLSPLSPEWVSNRGMELTAEDSALLGQFFRGCCSKSPRRIDSFEIDIGITSPPPSPIPMTLGLSSPQSSSDDGEEEDEDEDFQFLSGPTEELEWCHWRSPPTSPESGPIPLTSSSPTLRPFLHRLDIPTPGRSDIADDEDDEQLDTLEDDDLPTPLSTIDISFADLPRPQSEPVSLLPEIEDDLDDLDLGFKSLPSSPSRRQYRSLPEWDLEDGEPSSPGQHLLSLPGTETDDDLIPADLSLPAFIPSQHLGKSLLLIDDPNDVPPPRSPSPEHFDLDLASLDESTASDPDLHRLCDLRKKAVAAERAARQLEAQMLDQGDVWQRAEARKLRKKEKERCRELSALLRLKLGDKSQSVGTTTSTAPRGISSLPQLVARMMFRRNDRFRPLANRKTGPEVAESRYVSSSLSSSFAAPVHDMDLEDVDVLQ